MKKSIKIWSFIALAGFLFASCSKMNELPKFDDKDAFVAFNAGALSVNEDAGTINIPVTLVSLNGFTTSISVKAIDGSARSGVNYALVSNSLSFTPSTPEQGIQVQIINLPGLFTGDLSFTLELEGSGDVSLGAAKSIRVTIADLDHPLAALLGTWEASGESVFDGPWEWDITISKDENDVSKVWFSNFIAFGSSLRIFGIVNADISEIKVPVHQAISTSSSYGLIRLDAFRNLDEYDEEELEDGEFVTIQIAPDKKSMVIIEAIASAIYWDTVGNDFSGWWYNGFYDGVVLVKK